jgi:hypothetical protein
MSVHDFEIQLTHCLSSDETTTKDAAQQAVQFTDLFKAGKISKEEYIELMEDTKRTANINRAMDDLDYLQNLNTAINGLIQIANMA